jgi:hypothetical protein
MAGSPRLFPGKKLASLTCPVFSDREGFVFDMDCPCFSPFPGLEQWKFPGGFLSSDLVLAIRVCGRDIISR